jgi:hypothetical protein
MQRGGDGGLIPLCFIEGGYPPFGLLSNVFENSIFKEIARMSAIQNDSFRSA